MFLLTFHNGQMDRHTKKNVILSAQVKYYTLWGVVRGGMKGYHMLGQKCCVITFIPVYFTWFINFNGDF